ncbi:hypothetical protein MNBD_GAMMA13-692 [hydrothermal vent metagenome]|uniref:Bacterial virulence protein VirB8 domain-containing protein n=1 Tax=hydrothermal vent metagenome TaxID=652676 RepID=A0A3B0Z621_9ZZZZ
MSRTDAKALISKQGAAGSLVLMLRRYAVLGWVLFFLLALYTGAFILVKAGQPIPVLTMDQEGRLLGNIDYVDPLSRTDIELISSAKYFLLHHLSATSATIYEDAAVALSMMGDELRERTVSQYKKTNQLREIEKADVTSRITFARDSEKRARVVWRRNDTAAIALRGDVRIGDEVSNPYYVELTVQIVPRTQDYAHGIKIIDIRDM